MDIYNSIVLSHRNSTILTSSIIVVVELLAMLFLHVYIGEHFKIGKCCFPAAMLLLIPIIATIVFSSVVIFNCNMDISQCAYEVYVGNCTYESETVTLNDDNLKFYVGLGHEIVPVGKNYGKCIYSKYSKVIVGWEALTRDKDNISEFEIP